MTLDPDTLAAACAGVRLPVAVLDADGRCVASFGGFRVPPEPLPAEGVHAAGDRDIVIVPLGAATLAVEVPVLGGAAQEVERLVGTVRRQASTIRRRTLEAELARREAEQAAAAERAALVELLAHEANSPLAVLLGDLEFLAGALPPGSADAAEAFADARAAAARLADIVRQLAALARPEAPYRRIAAPELLAAFDAARGAQTRRPEDAASVLGDAAVVLAGLRQVGAQLGSAPVRVGVSGEGVVLTVEGVAAVTVPPELAALGVRWRAEGAGGSLEMPFRLLPLGAPTHQR